MTSPVAPDAAPPVPEFPALGDPAFNSKAYTWATAIPALVTWISGAIAKAYQNALSAFESATASQSNASLAAASALNAANTANFKGDWAGLTGPLAPPASVTHLGLTWNLLSAVADVTLAVPGVSPAWRAHNTVFPIEDVNAATVTMVSGNEYNFKHPGAIDGTMPAMVEGAAVVVTVTNDRRDNVLRRASPTDSFMGKAPDDITLLTPGRWVLRVVNGSWRGF